MSQLPGRSAGTIRCQPGAAGSRPMAPHARGRSAVRVSLSFAAAAAMAIAASPSAGSIFSWPPKAGKSPVPAAPNAAASTPQAWLEITPSAPPYNLLLLSLDTTRFDYLSCYGFSQSTSPNLDRLAADGILFENTQTPVPVTLPAHTTMLTGLYPFEHGVRSNGSYVVSPETVTLPELLRKHGYATGAILGAFPLEKRFGLNQGFDLYDDQFPAGSVFREVDVSQRKAADVTRLALEWLDRPRGGPVFLWCHYYDPHAPYQPPEPHRTAFSGDPYAGEIAYMDAEIGRLLDGVRSRGLWDRTVIIVAADHGEGRDEHGEHTHLNFIYETTQHVPMLLRLPAAGAFAGSEWRGRRVAGLTSLIDILPTAWNSLGLPREELPAMAGVSLLPVATRGTPAHGGVYHETLLPDLQFGASELRGYQDRQWKYIRAPQPELYDLQRDPRELKNLARHQPETMRRMEASLDSLLRTEVSPRAPVPMDAETIEKLRSLGYVAGGARPSTAADKPDPKEMIWVIKAVLDAGTLAASYRPAEALCAIDSVLTVYPNTPTALRLRASCLTRLGRGNEAVRTYDRALTQCAGCPDESGLRQERTRALVAAGRNDEALRSARELLQADPTGPGCNLVQGEVCEATGDLEGARLAYAREAECYPRDPLPLVRSGLLEVSRNRPAEAEKAYRRALEINPRHVDALVMLGVLLDNTGRTAEASALTERAIAADPEHPGTLMRQASGLRRQGNLDGALAGYRAALARQPDNPDILYNLGALYAQMNRSAQAEDAYEEAIATGKAPQGVYANLGVLLANQGKLAEAVRLWEEGLRRKPDGRDAATLRNNLTLARSKMKTEEG